MSHDEKERDAALVRDKHNTARYFTETRHVAWVLLVATLVAGLYGYMRMPKRKDPQFQVRLCLVTCLWPGASADRVEQLVTRKLEQKISENSNVEKIESISRSSVSIVYITLKDNVKNRAQEFDDLKLRLDAVHDLPEGAGPIVFHKDFGDTAALMLTVASPKVNGIELDLRARSLERAIRAVRKDAGPGNRATVVVNFPPTLSTVTLRRAAETAAHFLVEQGDGDDVRVIGGPGFLGIDLRPNPKVDDAALIRRMFEFVAQRLRLSELHPDIWVPFVVRDPATSLARMSENPGDRYSYRELDDFTEQIQRYLQAAPLVSKVTRAGVLPEEIRLEYSQERLAANGIQQSRLSQLLATRNITMPGGVVEIGDKNISIDPSGQLKNEHEIGDMIVGQSPQGAPLYLRDLVEITRDYQSPARFLNYYLSKRPSDGALVRNRAITLAVQMRPGEQIADFGVAVDKQLATVRQLLPDDLIVRRTSDQPLQVTEAVDLFMNSLYEAIGLVLIVTLIGFWEWRTAMLMALAIPITLAMTFAFMNLAGIDIQQISIASLILALGLLIDDPVVAADAIKRSMALGWKPLIAAWLGPTKLATAILFATITNIAAYLPLLVLTGDTGSFVYSLPIVLTLSLVASRIVSMTFIPLLGSVLLRPPKHPEPPPSVRRRRGFARFYSSLVLAAMANRKLAAFLAVVALGGGVMVTMLIRPSFFPKDNQYLSYVDVWLPEDSTLSATRDKVAQVSSIIERVAADFGSKHPDRHGKPRPILASLTEFVGGGGPRFWLSVFPEQSQLNYAQVIIQVVDKDDTPELAPELQRELSRQIAGALVDVRELETGKPIGIPVSVRLSGEDGEQLRRYADNVKQVFRDTPNIERVRDDWGSQTFSVKLAVDPDRANMAGVTNLDVAVSSAIAMNGHTVSVLREGDKQIPIIARLRVEERAQLTDIKNLYVTSLEGPAKVPLGSVSRISYGLETEKIRRRNQFRTITVAGFPVAGVLPSEVVKVAKGRIDALAAKLPPGYSLEWGGEFEEQNQSFADLVIVLVISTVAIFLALLIQFKNAVKPLIVFMTLPFGAVGALVSLVIADAPFSFMAFLGVVSLMGVIVSHVIVLFDFIEEMQELGEPLADALVDAGVVRLRPVLITVGATVLGLIPLAIHGGPLWQPLCFAQIGGLCVATFLTLLLVPVFYSIAVRDLGWIRWVPKAAPAKGGGRFTRTMVAMDVVESADRTNRGM
jgi:multidrug efflux pump subunit AcrB